MQTAFKHALLRSMEFQRTLCRCLVSVQGVLQKFKEFLWKFK